MRTIIRALALLAPIFAAAALGTAQQAGILAHHHVTQGKAIGFIVACFAVGLVVLFATRKKETQQRQPARQWPRPSYRTGRR